MQREIAIMKKLCHKNIIKLYEVIDDEEHDKLYLSELIYNFTFTDDFSPKILIKFLIYIF